MKRYLFIICLVMIFLTFSCGEPPKDIKQRGLLQVIYENLTILNDLRFDKKKRDLYFKELLDNLEILIFFEKDDAIDITSHRAEPGRDSIAYTIEKNQFKTNQGLYVTYEKKDMVISLDNYIWYSTENNLKKNIESIKNEYFFDCNFKNNHLLSIQYQMDLSIGETPQRVEISKDKPIKYLTKGMVLNHKNEEAITVKLEENILYVPKDTLFTGELHVAGNLVHSRTLNNHLVNVKALKNLYVYLKKNLFSLSFDRKKWDLNLFAFEIEPNYYVIVKDEKHIDFDIRFRVEYNENKKSMSIVKFFLDML